MGGRAAMEYTRGGAHGAASGEGAESSSSIVRGEGISQDMSHAKLKTICHETAGEDVEVSTVSIFFPLASFFALDLFCNSAAPFYAGRNVLQSGYDHAICFC